ncbi:MAG: DUF11 domain-containing protein, partial [Anaerolineae bacterium]|nr:DUF11 domain-containing protein [Anaerolineae bacterium]
YPFTNWSDAVTPRPGAWGAVFDEHRLVVGVVNGTDRWRTAFFPFPLEALDDAGRQKLLGRTLLWLSPLGESRLEAPPFVAAGERIPITLTLRLATADVRTGLRARLSLPAGLAVVPESVRGPWSLEADGAALAWAGALAPGETLRLHAALVPTAPSPVGAPWPLRAALYAGNGLTVTADADVFVDVPWLVVHEEVTPSRPWPNQTVQYTITVQNIGRVASSVRLTDTLPAEIQLLAGSVWAARGAATASAARVRWTDVLAPGERAQLGFAARIVPWSGWRRTADRVEVTDERGRRVVTGAVIAAPARTYLPVVWRK